MNVFFYSNILSRILLIMDLVIILEHSFRVSDCSWYDLIAVFVCIRKFVFELNLTEIDFHFGSNLEILLMKLNSNAIEFWGKGTYMRLFDRSLFSGHVC